MAWRIELSKSAEKQFDGLDRQVQANIRRFIRDKIATDADPRRFGEPLRRELIGLWKYRDGDYRIIADIQDELVLVLVVRIGHRRKAYGGH